MILLKNNYVEDERLFSTGDSELDEILEEVYYSGISDGYDYAQKEFAKVSNMTKSATEIAKLTAKFMEDGQITPKLKQAIDRSVRIKGGYRLPKTESGKRGLRRVLTNTKNKTIKATLKEQKGKMSREERREFERALRAAMEEGTPQIEEATIKGVKDAAAHGGPSYARKTSLEKMKQVKRAING